MNRDLSAGVDRHLVVNTAMVVISASGTAGKVCLGYIIRIDMPCVFLCLFGNYGVVHCRCLIGRVPSIKIAGKSTSTCLKWELVAACTIMFMRKMSQLTPLWIQHVSTDQPIRRTELVLLNTVHRDRTRNEERKEWWYRCRKHKRIENGKNRFGVLGQIAWWERNYHLH